MKNLNIALTLLSVVALSGCETVYNGTSRRQEQQTKILQETQQRQQVQRNTEIAMASVQEASVRLSDIEARLDRLDNGIRTANNAGTADIANLQTQLASLKAEIAEVRADRERMKSEIIDEISGKIATLMASKQASTPRTSTPAVSQTGYEHKVQSGQTLSAIAQAYGVTVDKIKKANDLKSDTIRVGQTLFIPD